MAYTTINKPADYFNTVLYTGDGTNSRAVTGVGFQPDFAWLKNRSNTTPYSHQTFDSVRGTSAGTLYTDLQNAEDTNYPISSFDSDGITLRATSHDSQNGNGNTFALWSWLAANGTASNTDGDITSTVSANTTSGFSIVSFTGNGGSDQQVGHGLGTTPTLYITKDRTNASTNWHYHTTQIDGGMDYLLLNSTNAAASSSLSAPSSTTIRVGGTINTSSANFISYVFAEKKGFSKFGSYTGVLSPGATALGSPFVYTGFKPAMVILKSSSHVENWHLKDAKRDPFNYVSKALYPNLSSTEGTITNNGGVDFYSNGFGINYGTGDIGSSGKTYIYMAFAENPLVTSGGTPATAR